MIELRLFMVQRLTAAAMVPLIVVHVIVIYYATANGLTAADILNRTRGSFGWSVFYAAFVVLASAHAAIGVRGVLKDWTRLRGLSLEAAMLAFGLVLLALGLRAVSAVV